MTGLGVSELAACAGVAPSTIRFYERVGLLSPAQRAADGYRVFDESEDIADLLAVWPTGECRSLQARLRSFVVERIGQVRDQRAELSAFERQLEAVLGQLAARDPGPDRCGKGCGCEADLAVGDDASRLPATWGCALDEDALAVRVAQWRAVLAMAASVERAGGSVRIGVAGGPDMVAELARLCAAETECCLPTRFVIEVTTGQISVTVTAPGAPDLLDALFPIDAAV